MRSRAWNIVLLSALLLGALARPASAAYLESDYEPDHDLVVPPRPEPPPVVIAPRTNPLRNLIDRVQVGAPQSYRGLTVFPLTVTDASSLSILTLDQALQNGELVLEEVADGVVEKLMARNRGARHVFIMEGEALLGGFQDRVAAQSVLLAPRQSVVLDVFCIQQGRWETNADERRLRGGAALAPAQVRAKLAESPSQAELWQEVDDVLKQHGVEESTGKLQSVYGDSAHLQRHLPAYRRELRGCITRRHAGVAIAVGGRIVSIDLFDNDALAADLWHKILDSHAATAAVYWREPEHRRVAEPTADDVRRILRRVRGTPLTHVPAPASGHYLTFTNGTVRGRALVYRNECVHASVHVAEVVVKPQTRDTPTDDEQNEPKPRQPDLPEWPQ